MKKTWPIILTLIILIIGLVFFYFISVKQTNGELAYPTDDTYIHMAIAKNFSLHGVWGGSQKGFSSMTSSPLWTLLLSFAYMIFGVNTWSPFLLNIICGMALCFLVWYLLQKHCDSPWLVFIFTLMVVVFMPLWPMMFLGMEHILHAFLNIAFVYFAGQYLSAKKPAKVLRLSLLAIAPFLVSVRYEGLFVLGIVGFMLLLKREYGFAILLGVSGILLVSVYGLYSVSQGWYFFPNSVLLKGGQNIGFTIRTFVDYLVLIVFRSQYLYILILTLLTLLYVNYKKSNDVWNNTFVISVIILFTIFTHLFFAETGWFYRYEAYLVATSIFVIAISVCQDFPVKKSVCIKKDKYVEFILILVLSFFAVLPLAGRAKDAFVKLPQATKNIYEQQCQMAFFVKQYYNDQPIVLNDIGAVAFYSDADIFDRGGLMNIDIARARLNNKYSWDYFFRLTDKSGAKMAILYGEKYQYGDWVLVGQWQIPDNVICARDTICFYSLRSSETEKLINNLRDFSKELPESIIEMGTYLQRAIP